MSFKVIGGLLSTYKGLKHANVGSVTTPPVWVY